MARSHPITSDCVACWRLDESTPGANAVDSGPNGFDAAPDNNPSVTDGLFGGAREIGRYTNGTGSPMRFAKTDEAEFHLGNLTLCAWVKFIDFTGDLTFYRFNVGKHKTGQNDYSFALQMQAFGLGERRVHAIVKPTGLASLDAYADVPNTPGEWLHLGMTYELITGQALLYINGSLDGSDTASLPNVAPNYTAGAFNIGGDSYVAMSGFMDDIALYNTVKDTAWFADIYGQGPGVIESGTDIPGALSLHALGFSFGVDPRRGSRIGSTRWPSSS